MNKRPIHGRTLSKWTGLTSLPPLDSLTILKGQQLVSTSPRISGKPMTTGRDQGKEATFEQRTVLNKELVSSHPKSLQRTDTLTSERTGVLERADQACNSNMSTPRKNSLAAKTNTPWRHNGEPAMMYTNEPVEQELVSRDIKHSVSQGANYTKPRSNDELYSSQVTCPQFCNNQFHQHVLEALSESHQHVLEALSQSQSQRVLEVLSQSHSNQNVLEVLSQSPDPVNISRSSSENKVMAKNTPVGKQSAPKSQSTFSTTPMSSKKLPQMSHTRALPETLGKPSRLSKSKVKVHTLAQSVSKVQRSPKFKEKVEYLELLPVSKPEDHLTDLEMVVRKSSGRKKKERKQKTIASNDSTIQREYSCLTPTDKTGFLEIEETESSEDDEFDNDRRSEEFNFSDAPVSISVPDLPTLNLLNDLNSKELLTGRSLLLKSGPDLQRRFVRKNDLDLENEEQRQFLAEQRRRKQQRLYNKLRSQPWQLSRRASNSASDVLLQCDSYDLLAKYCILNQASIEVYREVFDQADKHCRGWLSQEETGLALREVNNTLSMMEEEVIFRIIQMTGHTVSDGVDFRLFSTLAALSQRISNLDSQMKLAISEMNLRLLEMKTFLCKRLWEVCVEPNSKCISLDQLIIELRSGGISYTHELEVTNKLGAFATLDLLDFLIYSPLFFMIHHTIIENPLSDSRIM